MAPSFLPRSCFVSTPILSGLKLPRGQKQICTVLRLVFPCTYILVEEIGHMETTSGGIWVNSASKRFRAVVKAFSEDYIPSCGHLEV